MPESSFRRKIEEIGLQLSKHKVHDIVDYFRSGRNDVDFRAFISEVERLKPQTPAGRLPPRSGGNQTHVLGEERRIMDKIEGWFQRQNRDDPRKIGRFVNSFYDADKRRSGFLSQEVIKVNFHAESMTLDET